MPVNPTKSLGWPFLEKIIRLFLGTLLTLVVARQIGPAEFGFFSTSFAVFMLFSAVAGLGLKDVVIDEAASGRVDTKVVISAASGLMFASGLSLASILIITSILVYPSFETRYWTLIILSVVLAFSGFNAILFALEANTKLRAIGVAQQISVFASAVAKCILIFLGATAISFSLVVALEFMILYFALVFFAFRQNIYLSIKAFSKGYALRLLKQSWPLMVSSVAVIGYFYLDQVVINMLMGPEAVGVYAVASRVSQQLYAIPVILVAAYYPRLTMLNSQSSESFVTGLTVLCVVLIALSLFVTCLVFLLGDSLLLMLLGNQFTAAGEILQLHAIGLILVSVNIVSGRWYVMHGLQYLTLVRQILTAFLNIILNFLLIPIFGLKGAVFATLLSLFFLAFGFDFFNLKTRQLLKIKVVAVLTALQPRKLINAIRVLQVI